jgi:uncharacterized protein (DUF433 family)
MATTRQGLTLPFPRIIRNARIHGGEPVIRGTRVPVRAIVVAWREYQDMGTMLAAYPRLTEDDVREALRYYEAHRRAVDDRIEAQLVEA